MWKKSATVTVAVLVIALAGLFMACDKQENPVGNQENLEQTENGDSSGVAVDPKENPSVINSYPPYCFSLNVPFITQVPPGSWSGTKNCGQACGVMLGGYFNNGAVAPWVITAENSWLANYTGNQNYNQPNGWYTSGSNLGAYLAMLHQFHALNTAVYYGQAPDDVVNEINNGRPVIVGVMIKNGILVSSGGASHWALAVGFDGDVYIYLNDPGTSGGNHKRYIMSAFNASWATQGRIYIPVWK